MRIGIGYDFHRLVDKRKLMLGGVEVPYYRGLMGYSDADVLLHAICDAILGAVAEGDIGKHFPSTDSQWMDVASSVMLEKVVAIAGQKGFKVGNVDSTIVAEKPKLADYIPVMVENIAKVLGVGPTEVSVKATTTDGQGPVGKGEGMAAHAVVIMVPSGQAVSPGPARPPSPPSAPPAPATPVTKDFFEIS